MNSEDPLPHRGGDLKTVQLRGDLKPPLFPSVGDLKSVSFPSVFDKISCSIELPI